MVFEEHGWEPDPRLLKIRDQKSEIRNQRPAFRATAPKLRAPGDVPESWRRTLYDGPRVITPIWSADAPLVVFHTVAIR